MQEIMNSAELSELEKLNENPVLMSALKKIFLFDIYNSGIIGEEPMEEQYKMNYAFSLSFDPRTGQEYARTNEDLGKALRAINEALRIVSLSFQKIGSYKKIVNLDNIVKPKHR